VSGRSRRGRHRAGTLRSVGSLIREAVDAYVGSPTRPRPEAADRLLATGAPVADWEMPGEPAGQPLDAKANANAALFADITDEERDELVEYLAWYRERQRTRAR
jgi:hypothetical protein